MENKVECVALTQHHRHKVPTVHRKLQKCEQCSDTITHHHAGERRLHSCGANGKGDRMCTTTEGTLTLSAMLHDPLIRLVMRSDGVSEKDLSDLLLRVKDTLVARASLPAPTAPLRLAASGPVATSI